MKTKVREYLINTMLVVVIMGLLLVFHAVYVAGPKRAMEHQDKLYIAAFERMIQTKDLVYLDRFVFDKVYYIVHDSEKETIYWFNEDLTEFDKHDYIALQPAFERANELGYAPKEVQYGVFDQKLVFCVKTENKEIYLTTDDLSVVFEFGGVE